MVSYIKEPLMKSKPRVGIVSAVPRPVGALRTGVICLVRGEFFLKHRAKGKKVNWNAYFTASALMG